MMNPAIYELGLLEADPRTELLKGYPFEVQHAVISSLVQFYYKITHANELVHVSTTSHVDYAMEAIGGAFALDISREGVQGIIIRATCVYENWLNSERRPGPMVRNKQRYIGVMFQHMSQMFINRSVSKSSGADGKVLLDDHEKLCDRILDVMLNFVREHGQELEDATWDNVLRVLLGMCDCLLSVSEADLDLASRLCPRLIKILLEVWVRSTTRTEDNWSHLQRLYSRWTHRMHAVSLWSNCCLQLTMCMLRLAFGPDEGQPHIFAEAPLRLPDDDLAYLWHRMLYIMGNPNAIKTPANHLAAIQGITAMIDAWLSVGSKPQAKGVKGKPSREPPRPPSANAVLDVFGEWLFEAATMHKASRDGAAEALGILCRVFRFRCPTPFDRTYSARFLRIVVQALESGQRDAIVSVLSNSVGLFSSSVEGARMLLPFFAAQIRQLLLTQTNYEEVSSRGCRTSCLRILGSMIGVVARLRAKVIKVPHVPKGFPLSSTSSSPSSTGGGGDDADDRDGGVSIPVSDVHSVLADVLLKTLTSESFPPNQQLILCNLSVLLWENVHAQPELSHTVIKAILWNIKEHVLDWEVEVTLSALQVLSSLTPLHESVDQGNKNTIPSVVNELCISIETGIENLLEMLKRSGRAGVGTVSGAGSSGGAPQTPRGTDAFSGTVSSSGTGVNAALPKGVADRARVVASMFETLRQWIYAASHILAVSDTIKNVLKTIEAALGRRSAFQEPDKANGGSASGGGSSGSGDTPAEFSAPPLPESVRDEAQVLLSCILYHTHTHDSRRVEEGMVRLSTLVHEDDEVAEIARALGCTAEEAKRRRVRYFMLDGSTIVTVVEHRRSDRTHHDDYARRKGDYATIIVRDVSGRYAWDCRVDYVLDEEMAPFMATKPAMPRVRSRCTSAFLAEQGGWMESARDAVAAEAQQSDVAERKDMLTESLSMFQDLFRVEGSQLGQNDSLSVFQGLLSWESNREKLTAGEARLATRGRSYTAPHALVRGDNGTATQEMVGVPYSRMLCNHLGLSSVGGRSTFAMLAYSQRTLRQIKFLDNQAERESYKIGVLFVDKDQHHQHDVLTNTHGTEAYERFIKRLGVSVRLDQHTGFMGGLRVPSDPNSNDHNGVCAPYFASHTYEVIFHVPTMMPSNPKETQQIHKKRHVGNDVVTVVWSENPFEYRTDMLTTQFNQVYIVLYPVAVPNTLSLYHVRIVLKSGVNVGAFGPLQDHMVVTEDVLPDLVRQTAVTAYRSVRSREDGYTTPYRARKALMDELASRCSVTSGMCEYYHTFFANEPTALEQK